MSGDPVWKLVAHAPRGVIEAALIAHEDAFDWDPDIAIAGSEVAEDRPDDWRLEAWLPRKPSRNDRRGLDALFVLPPHWSEESLPATDWVTTSQQTLEPVRAGVFHVRTPDHAPYPDARIRSFVIPASQAFGTGHHATTAGCLEMMTAMKARGAVVRNCADIGTGSGLLAFAALTLWPRALVQLRDILAGTPGDAVNLATLFLAADKVELGAIRARLGQAEIELAKAMHSSE